MKIIVNYDLLERISEAKLGFSLVRQFKRAVIAVFAVKSVMLASFINKTSIELYNYLETVPLSFVFDVVIATLASSVLLGIPPFIRNIALNDLEDLAEDLELLNIDTTEDLLLDSYKYHTEYEFNFDKKIPSLVQKKYINIPVNGKEKEVSLLQEHVIGSFNYTLSKKKLIKQKALTLVPSNS